MTDINKHVKKLINMLQSPKASARYEACEYLRVAPEITPEAIKALQNALNDPDSSVAEAAQRALHVHTSLSSLDKDVGRSAQEVLSPPARTKRNVWGPVSYGVSSSLLAILIVPLALAALHPSCPYANLDPAHWLDIYLSIATSLVCLLAFLLPPIAAGIAGLSGRTALAVIVGTLLALVVSLLVAFIVFALSCFA